MLQFMLSLMVVAVLALAPPAVQAQTCTDSITATTPTSDFFIHGDGTATHNRTGLMWQRCSEGQTSGNGGCSGSAAQFTWDEALQRATAVNSGNAGERHGYSDWRLPNKNELESIVEESCYGPAINATVFPSSDTGSSAFWSSSPYAYYPDGAWDVYFSYGGVGGNGKNGTLGVRLVRGGQYLGLLGGPRIAQTPMSGPPGTPFAQWGTGFTPNSTVTLHFRNQLGEELTPAQKATDGQGAFTLTYTAPKDKPLGTHTWWAVDDTTGRLSDPLGYRITGVAGQVNNIVVGPPPITLSPVSVNRGFGELTSEGIFDPGKETFVIVHGWNTEDTTSLPGWMTEMGVAIKQKSGANVLYWNWQDHARSKYQWNKDESCGEHLVVPYDETEGSGKYLAAALSSALSKEYSQDIHFIGHSLGTLVSTTAAKSAKDYSMPYANLIKHLVFLDSPCYEGVPGGKFLSKNSGGIFLENYISIFGRSYKDADVNVWLPKAKDWWTDAHSYPYYWYLSSVNNFSDNILSDSSSPSSTMPWGFFWSNETNQNAAQAAYAQQLQEPHYQLFAGPPTAGASNPKGIVVVIGGIADALKQDVLNQLTDFAEATGKKVTLLSLKSYDTVTDIVGYATDVAGHALQEVADLQGHLTLTHASTAVLSMPVEIPTDANALAFGLDFLYGQSGSLLEVFVNDLPVYNVTSDQALDKGYQLVPWINVEQFAGQSVTLYLRLSNPNADTEGKILIDDLVVAKIEPGEPDTTATTTTSTTTGISTTTTTTIPGETTVTLPVAAGWNLLSSAIGFQAATVLGAGGTFTSVWKWADDGANGKGWAVYLPGETAGGAAYAEGKGFALLAAISPGEGFWVNASQPASLTITGLPVYGGLSIGSGWNLVGLKSSQATSAAELVAGATGIVSLWKWEAGKWVVRLPGNADSGQAYADDKGFGLLGTISQGEGFWVNATSAVTLP